MSSYDKLIQLTNDFEVYLGNPECQETPVNFKESLFHDEQDTLAWSQIEYIQRWGFMEYLIPQELGGKFSSLYELVYIVRSVGRRDLTTAIALGISCLAALPVWIGGSAQQKQQVADSFRRKEIGAFALTEEDHGSDAASNEVWAQSDEQGWKLSGKKWCINFATLSHFMTVVCRTHPRGGPLGFSVFLLNKAEINTGFKPLPKLLTHGVRGLDISGFTLDKVSLSSDALVGKEKRGLELTYKTLQVSRTLCAGFALGCGDTALRMALSFSLQRQLYGNSVFNIPSVKQRLGEQFTLLLIADCMVLTLARACSLFPEQLSFWSAIIKFLVPQIMEQTVEECGIIMGARAYLRSTQWAMFQKIRRDLQVVGLFDGSSQVNLSLIAGNLLPQIALRGTWSLENLPQLNQLFDLEYDSILFDTEGLRLFSQGEDELIAGLAFLNSETLKPLIHFIQAELKSLDTQVVHLKENTLWDTRSLAAFRLAERYCWIFAASCCLQFWHFNHQRMPKELQGMEWITLAIQLILNRLGTPLNLDPLMQESMANQLVCFYEQNKMFSIVPTQIPSKMQDDTQ